MSDPYLYKDSNVLKNLLNITNQDELEDAEADYVSYRLREIAQTPLNGNYDVEHFFKMHWHIFQDLYEWAGKPRIISIYKEEDILGGMSIEYSEPFDIVHDIHHVLIDMRCTSWTNMSKEAVSRKFSELLAKLWKIHPFREGNTRTTVTFCCQFADSIELNMNRKIFETNSRYVRTALVAYNAFFSDGSNFSKREYLEKIVYDAISSK